MTGWMLLGPATPMLFKGQEFSSSAPFLFFADHGRELGEAVRRGRIEFLAQFPSLTDDGANRALAPPGALETFTACKLDLTERERHREAYDLHRDLLALRRDDPVLSRAGTYRPEGAVLGEGALVLRYLDAARGDQLSVVNLALDRDFSPAGEPLLASPLDTRWRLAWSSEAPHYGGQGVPPLNTDGLWRIAASSTML